MYAMQKCRDSSHPHPSPIGTYWAPSCEWPPTAIEGPLVRFPTGSFSPMALFHTAAAALNAFTAYDRSHLGPHVVQSVREAWDPVPFPDPAFLPPPPSAPREEDLPPSQESTPMHRHLTTDECQLGMVLSVCACIAAISWSIAWAFAATWDPSVERAYQERCALVLKSSFDHQTSIVDARTERWRAYYASITEQAKALAAQKYNNLTVWALKPPTE